MGDASRGAEFLLCDRQMFNPYLLRRLSDPTSLVVALCARERLSPKLWHRRVLLAELEVVVSGGWGNDTQKAGQCC